MIHVIDSHRPVNLNNLFSPAAFATTYFRGGRHRGVSEAEIEQAARNSTREGDAPSIVMWSDAEGDESREAEKEAFEGLQVRRNLGIA